MNQKKMRLEAWIFLLTIYYRGSGIVHCHPKLPELCWVEANWKDGQADKDFDEHTKVKKVFQDWSNYPCWRCGMKDIVGHGSYARKKRWHFLHTLIPHLLFFLTFCQLTSTSTANLPFIPSNLSICSFIRLWFKTLFADMFSKDHDGIRTRKMWWLGRFTNIPAKLKFRTNKRWVFWQPSFQVKEIFVLLPGEEGSEWFVPVVAAAHQRSWLQRGAGRQGCWHQNLLWQVRKKLLTMSSKSSY